MATSRKSIVVQEATCRACGTANQSAALLAMVAVAYSVWTLVVAAPPGEAQGRAAAVWFAALSLGYLLAQAAQSWRFGLGLRRGLPLDARLLAGRTLAAGLVVVGSVAVVARGERSMLLLARLEGVLTACATAATIVLLLAVAEWLLPGVVVRADMPKRHAGRHTGKWGTAVELLLAVAWAVVVVWIEAGSGA